jgi:hypothetical protein
MFLSKSPPGHLWPVHDDVGQEEWLDPEGRVVVDGFSVPLIPVMKPFTRGNGLRFKQGYIILNPYPHRHP